MPIYEYQCEKTGEIFEYFWVGEKATSGFRLQNKIACQIHNNIHSAEKIYSVSANLSIGKPTIIFRNPQTGETEVATMDNQPVPHGYIREELKNPIERSKFEKEETTKKNVENEFYSEAVYLDRERRTKERQANIRAKMSQFDGPTQSLLKAAMERTRNRPFKPKKSEVRLDVNHKNQSNLIVESTRKTKPNVKKRR